MYMETNLNHQEVINLNSFTAEKARERSQMIVTETAKEQLNTVLKKIDDTIEEDDKPIKESNIKVENFSNFLNRIKIKLEDDPEDSVVENSVPKQLPQVKCTSCGVEVDDTEADMERHLYSKHNFKPTVDDIDVWLLEYFPPNITED
jgi:hypothetical protein